MRLVSKSQRKKALEKFESTIGESGATRLGVSTCVEETQELESFLLTGCDVNDLIEYVDNKILAWALTKDNLEHGDPMMYRFANLILDAYKTLLDVVGEY
jgi:hypothetical protein